MKLCESCRYRNNTEYEKPCVVYRDDCEFYEKERGDMSREEAIKELQESHDIMRSYDIDESESRLMTALNMAIKALEQESKWIPVSERLPESHGWYLVTKKDRHPYKHEWTGGIHCRVERYIEHSLWGRSNNCGVVAWMPLPKPYKAESEGKG